MNVRRGGNRAVVRAAGLLAAALAGGACDAPTPVERGQALFASRALSPSRLNLFTCATCHDADAAADGAAALLRPGAAMAGVTRRPSFWGGQQDDLLRAINDCRAQFMGASAPLRAAEADGEALYAYLDSLRDRGDGRPVAFTVVREIDDLPRGEAAVGEALYARSCGACHGALHTGQGRLAARVPVLPEETLAEHASYTPAAQRLVFVEKIRHGGFLGYGGDMPPYSREVLSDGALSDLLEVLR